MRKLASIVEIESCEPIENTDRLSVAKMKGKGWKVVTGRDEYTPGDLAVYFEIDSYLNADDERYAFLRERCLRKFVSKSGEVLKEGIRIKTVKLRGVVSQGLLMPVEAFVGDGREIQCSTRQATPADVLVEDDEVIDDAELEGIEVADLYYERTEDGVTERVAIEPGTDLTKLLHVEHFDEIAEALRPATGGGNPVSADAMGKFPTDFIPKTDEERIQNLGDYFVTMKGRRFEVTEKNDGMSVTMFYSPTVDGENPFGVCSRNLRLKQVKGDGSVCVPWQVATRMDVEKKLRALCSSSGCELALQGELVGPGINSNRDLYRDYEWHVFKVWDITHGKYLLPSEARFACTAVGLEYVPVIQQEMAVFDEFSNVDDLLKFAEGKTARGNEREGLVFKSVDYPYVSFKAVSNRYLLKGG